MSERMDNIVNELTNYIENQIQTEVEDVAKDCEEIVKDVIPLEEFSEKHSGRFPWGSSEE